MRRFEMSLRRDHEEHKRLRFHWLMLPSDWYTKGLRLRRSPLARADDKIAILGNAERLQSSQSDSYSTRICSRRYQKIVFEFIRP